MRPVLVSTVNNFTVLTMWEMWHSLGKVVLLFVFGIYSLGMI
jgi:hypothetical protein